MALFSYSHTIYINPIITIICFASLFPQVQETLSRPSPGTLSVIGLAIQAVVFAVVALYWPWRMTLSRENLELPPLWRLVQWYRSDGWATVDNAVFAFVQADLWWIAVVVRQKSGVQEVAVTTDKNTPLLQD
jgi:heme/copper-type cytochrome/quinol oxidase subunit 2